MENSGCVWQKNAELYGEYQEQIILNMQISIPKTKKKSYYCILFTITCTHIPHTSVYILYLLTSHIEMSHGSLQISENYITHVK